MKFGTQSLRSAKADTLGLPKSLSIFPPLQVGEEQVQEIDTQEGGLPLLCDVWQMSYHLDCGNSVTLKGYE